MAQRHRVGVPLLDGALLLARLAQLRLEPGCKLLGKRVQSVAADAFGVLRKDGLVAQVLAYRAARQARDVVTGRQGERMILVGVDGGRGVGRQCGWQHPTAGNSVRVRGDVYRRGLHEVQETVFAELAADP